MKLKLIKHNHLRTIQQVRPSKFTFPKGVLKVYSLIDNSLTFWWQTTNYSQFWNLYTVLSLYRISVSRVVSIVTRGILQPLSKKKLFFCFQAYFKQFFAFFAVFKMEEVFACYAIYCTLIKKITIRLLYEVLQRNRPFAIVNYMINFP